MKRTVTQAWGWLAAGVLAAGLNASYHDGGLQWAHQIANRVQHHTATVVALASGRADQVLGEARLLTAQTETSSSCPLTTTIERIQSRIAGSETVVERFDVMSAREQRQFVRLEANRARMEPQIAAQTAHIRIATAAFAPITVNATSAPVVCPRVRVNVPRLPRIKMPVMPQIHIESVSAGPV